MEIKILEFHRRNNETGKLTFLEGGVDKDIPFDIRRVYYIYDVAPGEIRGFHAHKKLNQVLICINGSCKILLDDGQDKIEVELNNPAQGLVVEPKVWHEMYEFSPNAILLVMASDFYDESDYLRDYQQFVNYLQGGK